MSIRATCYAGAEFDAKAELAGRTVKCPKCHGSLTVPKRAARRQSILVRCKCGSSFKAKPEFAGKQLSCPSCASGPKGARSIRDRRRIRLACECGRAFKVKSNLRANVSRVRNVISHFRFHIQRRHRTKGPHHSIYR